jgi:hypothetical protein
MIATALWRFGRHLTVFAAVGTAASVAVYLASGPEQRRLIGALQLSGATSADTAMSSYELAGDQSHALDRLVREGLVVATGDRRFYLGESERITTWTRKANTLTAVVAVLMTAAALAVLFLASKLGLPLFS